MHDGLREIRNDCSELRGLLLHYIVWRELAQSDMAQYGIAWIGAEGYVMRCHSMLDKDDIRWDRVNVIVSYRIVWG